MDVRSFLMVSIEYKLLPTYWPGGDWLCGSCRQYCCGGEFLWSEFVVPNEAVGSQAEI